MNEDNELTELRNECDELEKRKQKLATLKSFINSTEKIVNDVFDRLKLDKVQRELLVNKYLPLSKCPYNSNHMMPEKSLQHHSEICKWKQNGYFIEDIKSALSQTFMYENKPEVVFVPIDQSAVNHILQKCASRQEVVSEPPDMTHQTMPLTYDRETVEFSREERLAIYEYVVEKGKQTRKRRTEGKDLTLDWEYPNEQVNNKKKSKLETLAEARDLKRRRQTYRGKNVHTGKKSYSEVIKEVIDNQMELFRQTIAGVSKEDNDSRASEHRRRKRSRSKDHSDKEKHKSRKKDRQRSRSRSQTIEHSKRGERHGKTRCPECGGRCSGWREKKECSRVRSSSRDMRKNVHKSDIKTETNEEGSEKVLSPTIEIKQEKEVSLQ